MVYSSINSSIYYQEKQGIEPEDIGYESQLYELDVLGKTVIIAFGRPKYTLATKGVVFYPVYLIVDRKVKSQIGIVEVRQANALEIFDEDEDLDPTKIVAPLFFGFVTEAFVDRSGSKTEEEPKKGEDKEKSEEKEKGSLKETEKEKEKRKGEDEDEENDVVSLETTDKSSGSKEVKHATQTLQHGVFEHDDKIKPPPLLVEETEADVKTTPKYKSTSKDDPWIVKYLANNNYGIHQVEANGDCFFAVIREAYKQIGEITTVAKLRAIVAKEATQTVFDNQRNFFLHMDSFVKGYDKRIREYKQLLEKDLKERAQKARNQPKVLAKILEEEKKVEAEYEKAIKERRDAQNMIDDDVGDFSKITTLEEFRAYIRTSHYWADVWAISVIERVLQIKMIMFSERSFKEKALNSVLQCGEVDEELRRSKQFRPRFYIMTSFSGVHYKLVSYKNKKIFEYHEIPYNVRMLVVNKCIQRAEGPFYMIKEFREFAAKLGAEEDLRKVDENDDDDDDEDSKTKGTSPLNDLYDSKMAFTFHAKAEMSKKPGKGTNEKIEISEQSKFLPLHRMESWRRKLDDKWMNAEFKQDGCVWASVEHFYQGAKFRKQNPEFRKLFCLPEGKDQGIGVDADDKKDTPTIANSITLAEAAGSNKGKTAGKHPVQIRPANISIDPDFYSIDSKKGGRNEEEREIALRAKFTQNEDLKQLLMATYPAKLLHYTSGPPNPDIPLMVVRKELVLSRDSQSKKAE